MSTVNLISIITPCFNASDYLEETYSYLKAQTYSDWEWIVTDDCSTDNSLDIITGLAKEDTRIKVFKNTENSGAAVTRNNCLEQANGGFIAFLDSDDIWESNKLEVQIKFHKAQGIDFSYHPYWLVDAQGSKIKEQKVPRQVNQNDLYRFNPFATSSIMIRRDIIEKNHIRFRNHLRRRQDYFFWFDAIGVSNRALSLDQSLSSYRIFGNDSLSANKKKMAIIQWKLYRTEFKLGLLKSTYYFIQYAWHGVKKYFL